MSTDTIIKALLLFVVVAGSSLPARADEIRLKSGDTLADVEVLEKKADKWRIRGLDGKTATINAADVVEHVEKPTAGHEFDERAKNLKTKADVPKMVELAQWGMEKGARIHATKLLNRIIQLDRDNEEAREMLGHRRIDGKWLSGRDLEAVKAKAEEDKMKARGFVKMGEKWVDAYAARCLKAGLVEFEGDYYTKDDHKKVSAGMVFADGGWYTKDEEIELKLGKRKSAGKWFETKSKDADHKDLGKSPWILESRHFRLTGTLSHARLYTALRDLEQLWGQLRETFVDGPTATVPGKRVELAIGVDLEQYKALYTMIQTGDDRESFQSSNYPVFYSSQSRAAATYYVTDISYLQWLRHGAVWAYLGGFTDVRKLKSPMIEAFAAYYECTGSGKYTPMGPVWDKLQGLNFDSPRQILAEWKIDHRQSGMARIGFVMHFLKSKYPDDVAAFIPRFLAGATHDELLKAIEKREGNDLKESLNAFYREFLKK